MLQVCIPNFRAQWGALIGIWLHLQVLSNGVSNAAKLTTQGKITVVISCLEWNPSKLNMITSLRATHSHVQEQKEDEFGSDILTSPRPGCSRLCSSSRSFRRAIRMKLYGDQGQYAPSLWAARNQEGLAWVKKNPADESEDEETLEESQGSGGPSLPTKFDGCLHIQVNVALIWTSLHHLSMGIFNAPRSMTRDPAYLRMTQSSCLKNSSILKGI